MLLDCARGLKNYKDVGISAPAYGRALVGHGN